MSKFIKVQLETTNEWLLLNTNEIIEIGIGVDGYTRIAMKGVAHIVHQKMEDIEAQLLRDEFANYALKGLLSDSHRELSIDELSKISYEIADAMLKERMK